MLSEGRQRILVVVEGEKAEPALFRRCFDLLNQGVDYEIVPFCTNVYQLIRYIDEYFDGDLDAMDIRKVLLERHPEDANKLAGKITDVILVFGYDPQDSLFDQGRLERLLPFFCDSSDVGHGKLFLNYPSVESLRDFSGFGEMNFYESFVSSEVLPRHGYKRAIESREPRARITDFRAITGPELADIIAMNVGKIQHLVFGSKIEDTVSWTRRPGLSEECCQLDLLELLRFQGKSYDEEGIVYICGTCLFFACENWPAAVDGMWHSARS